MSGSGNSFSLLGLFLKHEAQLLVHGLINENVAKLCQLFKSMVTGYFFSGSGFAHSIDITRVTRNCGNKNEVPSFPVFV